MSRTMTSAARAAITGEVARRTTAIELDFAGGFVRMSGAPYDIVLDGQTYLGVGQLGEVSVVEETSEVQSAGITISLSGIPRDSVAVAMTQAYQGRPGRVWEVPLDADGAVIADPLLIFRGRMDQMSVELGDTATVRVTLQNRLADWERPRAARYTDAELKRRFPGDRGLEFVSATAEKTIVWPTADRLRQG